MGKKHSLVPASDGLLARSNGSYALEKLSFLERFGPVAIQATERKFQRVYVDLFAGPGLNVDPTTGSEFEGAALQAIRQCGSRDQRLTFTQAILVNKHRAEKRLLEERIARARASSEHTVRVGRIDPVLGDANREGIDRIASLDRHAYALVFADPASPGMLPWSTIEAIATRGPASTDLYVLIPLEMGVMRLLPYEQRLLTPNVDALNRYFGCDDWRAIYSTRLTERKSREARERLLALYEQRLRAHWRFVKDVRTVRGPTGQILYRMVFCTRHEAAYRIMQWEEQRHVLRSGQLGLFA